MKDRIVRFLRRLRGYILNQKEVKPAAVDMITVPNFSNQTTSWAIYHIVQIEDNSWVAEALVLLNDTSNKTESQHHQGIFLPLNFYGLTPEDVFKQLKTAGPFFMNTATYVAVVDKTGANLPHFDLNVEPAKKKSKKTPEVKVTNEGNFTIN